MFHKFEKIEGQKYIEFRCINEKGLIPLAIDWVTFSKIDHVEIITDKGTYIGAHAVTGVQERPADYCKPTWERRYALAVTNEQYDKIMSFARAKIGTKYNYVDIAGLFIHHDMSTPNREICSMFVFEAFLAGGIQLLNVLPGFSNLVTPETIHLSNLLIGHCTYEFPKAA